MIELGNRFSFVGRISKTANVYYVAVPKALGKELHGRHVVVKIKVVDGSEETQP